MWALEMPKCQDSRESEVLITDTRQCSCNLTSLFWVSWLCLSGEIVLGTPGRMWAPAEAETAFLPTACIPFHFGRLGPAPFAES